MVNTREYSYKFQLPHIIKIAEAYSAIADGRVKLDRKNQYIVFSSDYTKKYTVEIRGDYYSSNDNMSYNYNVLGYPIVAVLMVKGIIHYNFWAAKRFQNICWTKVNLECNKDFSRLLEIILKQIGKTDKDIEELKKELDLSYKKHKRVINIIYHKKGDLTFEESFLGDVL